MLGCSLSNKRRSQKLKKINRTIVTVRSMNSYRSKAYPLVNNLYKIRRVTSTTKKDELFYLYET